MLAAELLGGAPGVPPDFEQTRLLATRGLAVDDGARARIAGCTDLEQLDEWLIRAVTVGSVDHLFP